MARLIYKEGFEGQNKLEYIEGIEIDLLNNYKALIYPKYAELTFFLGQRKKINNWDEPELNEFLSLKVISGKKSTDKLLELGSFAANHVRKFKSNKYGVFNLPPLLASAEISYQKKDIDILAETIEGADLLKDFCLDIWSCCRYISYNIWAVNNCSEFMFGDGLYDELLVVPTIIYK